MILSSICAMAPGRVIGKDGAIPWHLPQDLANFKRLTWGKPIIMGRRTYESIGRPLPGRRNIVLSRRGLRAEQCQVCPDLEAALRSVQDAPEAFIIGGAQLYAQALPLVQRQYLSLLHREFRGDAFYPELEPDAWSVKEHAIFGEDELPWSFIVLERALQ